MWDFSVVGLLFLAVFEAMWIFRRRRWAVLSIVLSWAVTAGVLYAIHQDTIAVYDQEAGQVVLNMAISLAFAIGVGLWWTSDQKNNLRNAALVDQLRRTREQLAVTQHAAGVNYERERMAQEIHDTLAQGYTTILMQTQAAERALGKGDLDKVRERHGVVMNVARDNLAEARALVAAFAPAPLHDATLTEALERIAGRWSAETSIPIDLRLEDVGHLSADHEVVLLRAAQEALSNVAKHAGASRVTLRLGGRRGLAVRLVVADDGHGIAAGTADGYGLTGMRSRVEDAGGTLSIEPGPDAGTVLRITIPPDQS
jgi:signal transduction histidine kinase